MFESDGLFSLSGVLSSSFVRFERFYCSIVSDLEIFYHDETWKIFRESFVNDSRVHGRERGLLSIPRQEFNVLDYSCPIVRIVKCSL